MARVKLVGRVLRITYQNPENGYTVASLQVPGQRDKLVVVGRMPDLTEGQEVEVQGREVVHPSFGKQVEVESYRVRPPSDEEGMRRYLASGLIKGVGPKLAQAIVEHLGSDALEVILNEPQRLGQVPGIGPKRARTIAKAVKDHGQLRELMVFLQSHGIPASTALRIHRAYGAGALGVVKNHPHRLAADIRGIGFATADQIAARLGIARDHPTRLASGLLYTLNQARDEGHVYLPYDELLEKSARLLRVERGLLGPALATLLAEGRLVQEEEGGERAVYLAGMYALELRAARALARLARRPGILSPQRAARAVAWVEQELAVRPSRAQAQALEQLLTAGLTVLTGGPGTGKTTLVRALVTIALRMGLTLALAAPTGRAAKRLQEATGQPAQTLHRLLEYSPKENRFQRHASRPLEADLVVVDESSMIDLWLMAHLADALGERSRLVLVGDADQLPSVGPGLVLRQIMDSGQVAVARLQEIFRQDQAGLIVKNAHRILHGRMPQLPPPGDAQADFHFLEEPDPEKAAELVAELAASRLPRRLGLDPVQEIQVLSPMHRGNLGCRHLNRLLRARLNPDAKQDQGPAPGDKVMQQRNNYELEVFNGDVGVVLAREGEGGLRVALGEREVVYSALEQEELALAYAVTVHKSQGSEYPAVVIALGMEHFIMLNRNLLYTAVTRGKRLVVLVGHRGALEKAVRTADPSRRYARLDYRLRRLLAEG